MITHASKVVKPEPRRLDQLDFRTRSIPELEDLVNILNARIKKLEHDFLRSSVHSSEVVSFGRGYAKAFMDLAKDAQLTIDLKRSGA